MIAKIYTRTKHNFTCPGRQNVWLGRTLLRLLWSRRDEMRDLTCHRACNVIKQMQSNPALKQAVHHGSKISQGVARFTQLVDTPLYERIVQESVFKFLKPSDALTQKEPYGTLVDPDSQFITKPSHLDASMGRCSMPSRFTISFCFLLASKVIARRTALCSSIAGAMFTSFVSSLAFKEGRDEFLEEQVQTASGVSIGVITAAVVASTNV